MNNQTQKLRNPKRRIYNFFMRVGVTIKENEKNFYITRKIPELLISRGVSPLLLPAYTEIFFVKDIVNVINGLVLVGGGDLEPSLYGQDLNGAKDINIRRDKFEIELVKKVAGLGKPIFAICRGMQVLNVAFGGTLIQHVEGHYQKEKTDVLTHKIFLRAGTKLHKILNKDNMMVNSFHHQVVDRVSPSFTINAVSEDGYIEGIENKSHPFLIGVQFHPEYMHNIEPFSKIFDAFTESLK